MKIGGFSKYNLVFVIVIFILTSNLYSQNITPPIVAIDFGTFVNINGGKVVIDPRDGDKSPNSADIIILTNGSSGSFEVSSTVGSSQKVTLTATPTNLSPVGSGTGPLVISDLYVWIEGSPDIEALPFTFTLNDKFAPPTRFYIGGTLTVVSADSEGIYEGSVTLSIETLPGNGNGNGNNP